jgi:hypothetical protein
VGVGVALVPAEDGSDWLGVDGTATGDWPPVGVASACAPAVVATEAALTMVDTATPAIRRRRTRRALAFFDMTKISTSCGATLRRTKRVEGVSGQ